MQLLAEFYGIFAAIVFVFVAIRRRSVVYLGAITWSRRFSQLTLVVIVFPIMVVMVVGSLFLVHYFFLPELKAFWNHGKTRGLVAIGSAVGFDLYLIVLASCCLLGWTRGVRCGSRSSDMSAATAIALMLVAVGVYLAVAFTTIGHLVSERPVVSSSPIGEFHSETCRRLMVSGC